MKKKLIKIGLMGFLPALFFSLLLYKITTNIPDKTKDFGNEISQIKHLIVWGDKLRGSNQDSCKLVYNKAIELANTLDKNEETNNLIGLGYVGIAALNCNMGNYPESLEYVELALKTAKNFTDVDIKAQATNIRGLLYFNQSFFDSAVICYQDAMSLAKISNNKQLQGKIHTNQAIIQFYQGKCDEAIAWFDKTLSIAKELQDIDLITGTYMNMGLVASNFGEYDKAIGFYQMAIETYKKINGTDGLVLCYQNLGSLYFSISNYAMAVETMQLSLKLAEEIGDKANIAKAHHNIAEVYARVGDHQQAMDEYLISIRKKEELNDLTALTDGYNGIGGLLYQQEQYLKALEYFEKAFKTSEELNLVKGKWTALSNIASVYSVQKNYNEAVKYYLKALELAEQMKNTSGISDLFVHLGNTYSELNQFEKADEFLNKALQQKIELTEKEGIATVYSELGHLELHHAIVSSPDYQLKYYKKAEDYGLKAYRLAKDLNSLPLLKTTSLLLKQIYTGLKNSPEALSFAEKYISINDSLAGKAKAEATTYAEARWSVEKQQVKIDNLANEKILQNEIIERKNQQTKQYQIILCIIVLLVIVLIAFLVFLNIFNKRKRDLLYEKQLNNLTLLKMQNVRNRISPHFIFNMLSSIAHSSSEPERLKDKVNNLSMLLRNVIENIEHTAISFDEELTVVKSFTKLQTDKIPSPFTFRIEIDPNFNCELLIPAMIIQIPVENALKHGFMPMEQGPCELKIEALKSINGSTIKISDNGMGLSNLVRKSSGTGTGLKMVMQTIQFMNLKNEHKILFEIKDQKANNKAQQGTIAEIFIPLEYSYTT